MMCKMALAIIFKLLHKKHHHYEKQVISTMENSRMPAMNLVVTREVENRHNNDPGALKEGSLEEKVMPISEEMNKEDFN
jgi:hypothetical protein